MIVTASHWTWWVRWMETRIVTDEGSFADTRVPDDYGGPELTVRLVQRVLLCTQSGHFQLFTFGDASKVMDELRQEGLGIYIHPFGEQENGFLIAEQTIIGDGPSEQVVVWESEENKTLDADFRSRMLYAYTAALANLEQ